MFALRKDSPRKLSSVESRRPSAASQQTALHRKASDLRPHSTFSSSTLLGGVARQDESILKLSSLPVKYETADGILQLQDTTEANSEVMCLRFSPDSSLLAAGFADGVVKLYNAESLQCMHTLATPSVTEANLPCTCIRFLGDRKIEKLAKTKGDKSRDHKNILLAAYTSGHVRFWHYTTNDCIYDIDENRRSTQTMSLSINATLDTVATVGADTQLFVYDLETKKRLNTLEASDHRQKMDGHKDRVFAVQFHPSDPHVFLTGGWDDTVQYWDSRNPRAFRRLYGPHICGDALDMDPVNSQIVTGSWRKEKALQVWDFGSAEKIVDVPDDYGGYCLLYCAEWFGKDQIVCGGSHRNRARVIDRTTLNTVGTLGELPQGVYCLDNDRSTTKQQRVAVGALKKVYMAKVVTPTAITTSKKRTQADQAQ